MNFHIRFLMAKIAVLTAIAGMVSTNTPEWDEVYRNRLICEMQLNLLEANDEQTPVEEENTQLPAPTAPPVEEVPQNSTAETEAPRPEEAAPVHPQPAQAPLYAVDGDVLDPGVAEYLYRRLSEAGIGWFYEYAVCLAYQESSFNPLAINPNGRDFGLYQFRIEFHPGLDWSNPYAQTDLFVTMMANRAAAGCDVYTMISRHNTSDWAPELNTVYINQVMSHFPALQRIR